MVMALQLLLVAKIASVENEPATGPRVLRPAPVTEADWLLPLTFPLLSVTLRNADSTPLLPP